MIDLIMDGISTKLHDVFGDGCEIYGDTDVVQGLKEPCFFIAVLNPSQTPRLGKRCQRRHPFNVQYFPATAGDNTELQAVASECFDALEYIILPNGEMLRGSQMSYEIVDGVLHFRVNYDVFLNKPTKQDNMETISVDANTI